MGCTSNSSAVKGRQNAAERVKKKRRIATAKSVVAGTVCRDYDIGAGENEAGVMPLGIFLNLPAHKFFFVAQRRRLRLVREIRQTPDGQLVRLLSGKFGNLQEPDPAGRP